MDTQKNIESIERDNSILKLVGKSMDNFELLKEIIDNLTTRIEKLEKEKLDKPREGYVVKTERVELFDE
jgi:chaperonin cofactor prefoldin|tara:strand:- start:637 stop:843 length:207 start_codon:yes stop_codon:yes gene_type:complete